MASKYESRADAPTITRRRHVLACARCRARRVKCDRAQPACSNCAKVGTLCQPAQQQTSLPQITVAPRPGKPKPADNARLSKLEDEVARLSREVDSSTGEVSQDVSPVDTGDQWPLDAPGKLFAGASNRYFSPWSWASVAEQLTDIQSTLQANPGDRNVTKSPALQRSSVRHSILSNESHESPPLDDQLHDLLLNIYSHRVDPLIRILHWPTFLKRCRLLHPLRSSHSRASPVSHYPSAYFPNPSFGTSDPGIVPNPHTVPSQGPPSFFSLATSSTPDDPFLALLSSVYYAAVLSVINNPSSQELGQKFNPLTLAPTLKKEVSDRILSLDEGVIKHPSIENLQALVLFLSVDSNSFDPYVQWVQIGTAVRTAQFLGIHRDGTSFGLSPIEVEVRRRIWAQICILDARFAELLGCEPSISVSSYDTCLPLSICDRDLTEIDEQQRASIQGQERKFKTLQEIEQEQEQYSPFSTMTFTLIEAELARLMTQLFGSRYRSRDSIFLGSVQPGQWAPSESALQSDRVRWIRRLEHRFETVYRLDSLDTTNPIQFMVLETMRIRIEQAKFAIRLMEWKDIHGGPGGLGGAPEMTHLFRDAIALTSRTLALSNRFPTSPYSWYIKRLKEAYTPSFLLFALTSGGTMDQGDVALAWAVLDQIFPVDSVGRAQEQGVEQSPLGVLLRRAKEKREGQVRFPTAQDFRQQAMEAAAGSSHPNFSPNVNPHPAVTLPTNSSGMGNFQPGNLFEDFDSIMQDPLWSPGLPGADDGYEPWGIQDSRAPMTSIPLRPRSWACDQNHAHTILESRPDASNFESQPASTHSIAVQNPDILISSDHSGYPALMQPSQVAAFHGTGNITSGHHPPFVINYRQADDEAREQYFHEWQQSAIPQQQQQQQHRSTQLPRHRATELRPDEAPRKRSKSMMSSTEMKYVYSHIPSNSPDSIARQISGLRPGQLLRRSATGPSERTG